MPTRLYALTIAPVLPGIHSVGWLPLPVQWFVFDVAPLALGKLTILGYHGLTMIFVLLVAIYGWAAVGGA